MACLKSISTNPRCRYASTAYGAELTVISPQELFAVQNKVPFYANFLQYPYDDVAYQQIKVHYGMVSNLQLLPEWWFH